MKTENPEEVLKFAKIAESWHKNDGDFVMLHKMNKLRCKYITDHADLNKKTVLDIGCGGGILSEKLSEIGAEITAIDPCSESIVEAKKNAKFNVNYIHITIEEFNPAEQFDMICIMEVVEHVDNLPFFIEKCASMLKLGGKIFFSTINRTVNSYLLAIIAAEYIFKYAPKNTHSWKKFVTPAEIFNLLNNNNIVTKNFSGMKYNIFLDTWSLTNKLTVNYIGYGAKS